MRRIGARLGLEDEVEAFLASDDWIDLLAVVRDQLITGTAMGLKADGEAGRVRVAGRGRRGWRSPSSATPRRSVTPTPRSGPGPRRWILEYNEDDVRATAALRQWLDSDARQLPSVADLCPTGRQPAAALPGLADATPKNPLLSTGEQVFDWSPGADPAGTHHKGATMGTMRILDQPGTPR